jgi:mono/diheme cytochrome c family protein
MRFRHLGFALGCAAAAIIAAGCGGGSDKGGGGDVDKAAGRKLFKKGTCATCHTLADANATGSVGPNLDDLQPDAAHVEQTIKDGNAVMPPGLLKGKDAKAVSEYVAAVAGSGGGE